MNSSEHRLVVISNRLPATLRATSTGWRTERSSGGLATAMNPMLKRRNGIWIGWPGEAPDNDDAKRREILRRWRDTDGLVPVELPLDVAKHYYEGYSNQTLWPLFHHFPSRLTFDPAGWAAYRKANMLFRDQVVAQYQEGDFLWVHDYQLMLLPQLLREALPQAAIGFFLHIPFPSSEVFRVLPEREELLEGLLGADLVAFHTYSHLQHFRSSLRRVLGRESLLDEVDAGNRTVRLEALPIGIAPEEFTKVLGSKDCIEKLQELKDRYQGRQILLAVDRMDYTKGIPERLRTYRRLLERKPELRGQVVLVQIAVPSREKIDMYDDLRRQVNELVGEINGQYATPDWTPVIYIRRGIPRAELVALYATADVAWVSPLRDGMNLVAKEYVACNTSKHGVLVLSEFAGAAEEMGEALLVNPNDEERTASVVDKALRMPLDEREHRMTALQDRVKRNNVFAWSEEFLSILQKAAEGRGDSPDDRPEPLDIGAVTAAYRQAHTRQLLLDYDGTLVGYFNNPLDASPSAELLELIGKLAARPENSVMIVSGRNRNQLEQWFGAVKHLWLAAEHGAFLRRPGAAQWEPLRAARTLLHLKRVRPILDHFVNRTPGSFVEEKEYSLVWHYRMVESRFAGWLAQELVSMLEDMLAETELRAIRGRKIVEVRPNWLHKGAIVERFMQQVPAAEFQLALGDDRTDEDLFAVLGPEAWTVHVGPERSIARFSLSEPKHVLSLLHQLGEE